MKSCKRKTGVTLVEMLIVVGIVALLATMVITTATRIDNQSREKLTESTIAILTAALGQFQDYGYQHKEDPSFYSGIAEMSFYLGLEFPLDCNDFRHPNLEDEFEKVLNAKVLISNHNKEPEHLEYSGSETLYFFLSRVPQCRKTLDKIDESLITNLNDDGALIEISIDNRPSEPLLRVIDPWGTTLRYDYYYEQLPPLSLMEIQIMEDSKRTFPLITSAGPDRIFNTADDISSR